MPDGRDQAWQAVRHARVALMMGHPYLASAIVRLPLVDATCRDWCPTCATDGFAIYVNLDYTSTLSEDDLAFVMAHELVHCIVGHMDRMGDRDRFVWNIAADYATNALLVAHGFRPMSMALLDPRLSHLAAEQIYDLLLSRSKSRPSKPGSASGGSANATLPDEIAVRMADGAACRLSRGNGARQVGLDAHLDAEGAEAGDLRQDSHPSEAERRSLRKELLESADKAAGSKAGRWKSEIEPATVAPLAWQASLAQFLSGLRRSDYRLFPPHRKHIHRGLYLPSIGIPGPQQLVVAIDTSGSMPMVMLEAVFAQIDHLRIATECMVTLLQFDAAIQSEISIEPWDPLATSVLAGGSAVGRGGTDLRVPFRWVNAAVGTGQLMDLDALIVITDGLGPVPPSPPQYPCLWVITPGGKIDCSFGAQVVLPDH